MKTKDLTSKSAGAINTKNGNKTNNILNSNTTAGTSFDPINNNPKLQLKAIKTQRKTLNTQLKHLDKQEKKLTKQISKTKSTKS